MDSAILVKYKGGLSKLVGCESEWLDYETGLSLEMLLVRIFERHPLSDSARMIDRHSVLIMRNERFVPAAEVSDIVLHRGDVITLLPTVSGG